MNWLYWDEHAEKPNSLRDFSSNGTKAPGLLKAANDNLPRVIAITGQAGAGKTTAADYLISKYGYVRIKFAGPLKDMCRALGMSEDEIEGNKKELPAAWLAGKTPRYVMQTLGGDWGRGFIGDDFWVGIWERRARAELDAGRRVIVDDCRYPNEAYTVRKLGGMVMKIIGRGGIVGSHASEAGCGISDSIIENVGCITGFYADVDEEVRKWAS